MAANIAYFGVDESWRTRVLASNGFDVRLCELSVPKLHRVLNEGETEAVALDESGLSFARRVSTITRSLSSASLILFEPFDTNIDSSKFDVIIPYGAPLSEWLVKISKAIEDSRAVRAEGEALREQARTLRRASMLERKRARYQQVRAHLEMSMFDRQQLSLENATPLVTPEIVRLQSKIYNLQYLLSQPNLTESQKQRLRYALSEAEERIKEILPF